MRWFFKPTLLLLFFLSSSLYASMSSANYVITPSVISEGDVNGDDNIDLGDVITALQIITGQSPATYRQQADMDSDGKIGIVEAIAILKLLLLSENEISITGPSEVSEVENVQYTCRAYSNDGSSHDITSIAQWSVNSIYANINTNGSLATSPVPSDQVVTITAQYKGMLDTHTVTIANIPGGTDPPNDPPTESRCKGLIGSLEVQVLIGPAEAVGLEPFAVGDIPFNVTTNTPPFLVHGTTSLHYSDVLNESWGTYTVSFDMDFEVSGGCFGSNGAEALNLGVSYDGTQLIVVEADGFHGEYPWSGASEFNMAFPLEEGATLAGEGWSFTLHINK